MKLFETIRLEDREFENLSYHQKRMDEARKELFSFNIRIDLTEVLHKHLKNIPTAGLFKCRIIYSQQIEKLEFIPYTIPVITSLKIVVDDQIDYSHKFLDRVQLEENYKRKSTCDDILIIKNGLITDTSYANIVFYNGKNWITPEKPLLSGTQRALLLHKEMIKTADIRLNDLMHFEKARLINAMIRFEDEKDIDIKNIIE